MVTSSTPSPAPADEHDRRVTELLAANNREVERRRSAERLLKEILDGFGEHFAPENEDKDLYLSGADTIDWLIRFYGRVRAHFENLRNMEDPRDIKAPFVVLAGNLSEGFEVYGPYVSFDEAAEAAEAHPDAYTCIMPIARRRS